MFHSRIIRHVSFRRGTIGRYPILLCSALVLLTACERDVAGPEEPLTYRVIAGACGDVVFAGSIGTDSASAMAVLEARKIERYGEGEVRLEPSPLEVVDEDGNPPLPDFYAVHVLDVDNGTHVHSVSEVITTQGDLFNLVWCPD